MQDFWMMSKSDSTSWRKTLQSSQKSQMQWLVVSTLRQETKIHLNRRVGSEGTPKLGPFWKLQLVACKGKYGVEIRIMSMNKANSHSWVRISHGLNKLVTNLFEQQRAENLRSAVRRICVKIEYEWFCKPIKGQRETTKTRICHLFHKNYTYWRKNLDRCWTRRILTLRLCVGEINSSSSSGKPTSRKMMERLNSGEQKIIFRTILCILDIGLTKSGRAQWQKEEETRKDTSIVLIHQEKTFFISELFKVVQDAIPLILLCRTMYLFRTTSPSTFIMSDVQSMYIPNTFLIVDPMDKNHKDPEIVDLKAPRRAQNMQTAWKRHQNTVYWVDINLALKKGLNAIILHETLPGYCIPKVARMETGEVIHEKVYASPRPPPKISLKQDWKREMGSEDAQRPDGEVVQQSKVPNQAKSKPRSWKNGTIRCWNQPKDRVKWKKNVPFPGDRNTFFSWRSC